MHWWAWLTQRLRKVVNPLSTRVAERWTWTSCSVCRWYIGIWPRRVCWWCLYTCSTLDLRKYETLLSSEWAAVKNNSKMLPCHQKESLHYVTNICLRCISAPHCADVFWKETRTDTFQAILCCLCTFSLSCTQHQPSLTLIVSSYFCTCFRKREIHANMGKLAAMISFYLAFIFISAQTDASLYHLAMEPWPISVGVCTALVVWHTCRQWYTGYGSVSVEGGFVNILRKSMRAP